MNGQPNPTENVETELELAERGELVKRYEALQRLKENEDFQLVVMEGYLKGKAVELTSLLATDYVRQNGLRGTLMEELVAISAFEEYMHMIDNLGAPVEEEEDEE
jgi:hypothetical protein